MIVQMVKETLVFRELLMAFTARDIRVKYKQAAMGVLWVFIGPVLAIAAGLLFRVVLGVVGGQKPQLNDLAGVIVKTVPWLLFAKIISGSVASLVSGMTLISKIYFPRHIMPLASVLSALFDFVISLAGVAVILTAICFYYDSGSPIALSRNLLWAPVLVVLLIALATALGLIFSAANLFLRDVNHVVQLALQYGIFFSLVFFTLEDSGDHGWLLLFNPVAVLLEGLRFSVVEGRMPADFLKWIGYTAALTLALALFSVRFFDRAQSRFAEYG